LEHFERFKLQKGDFLVREGDKSDDLYSLLKGCLKVEKKHGQRMIDLGTVLPGQLVGEMSFIDNEPRSADVKAFKESIVGVIEREKFNIFFNDLPPWFKKLQEILLKRLRESNDKLII